MNSQLILGLIVSSKEGALVTADFPLECLHTPGCTNVDSDVPERSRIHTIGFAAQQWNNQGHASSEAVEALGS